LRETISLGPPTVRKATAHSWFGACSHTGDVRALLPGFGQCRSAEHAFRHFPAAGRYLSSLAGSGADARSTCAWPIAGGHDASLALPRIPIDSTCECACVGQRKPVGPGGLANRGGLGRSAQIPLFDTLLLARPHDSARWPCSIRECPNSCGRVTRRYNGGHAVRERQPSDAGPCRKTSRLSESGLEVLQGMGWGHPGAKQWTLLDRSGAAVE
jgi:hypothetical protein